MEPKTPSSTFFPIKYLFFKLLNKYRKSYSNLTVSFLLPWSGKDEAAEKMGGWGGIDNVPDNLEIEKSTPQ